MKKILSSVILILLIVTIAIPVLAADITTSLEASSSQISAGEEVTVKLKINNFTRGTSNAIQAKLSYDTANLTYESMSFGAGWSGSISGDKTGIVINKTGTLAASEEIMTLKFKANQNATLGDATISLSNVVTSADGDEVSASGSSKTITIVAATENPAQDEPQVQQTEVPKNDDPTIANKKVDKTGISSIAIGAIIVISLIGTISYIRYRVIKF